MALKSFSDAEKTFIFHGVEANYRYDGRTRNEYRPMELETDVVSHASGSARLRLANTDILVGVKAEIDKPHSTEPNHGKLEFFVDCSANATPAFEGRGGEDLANELSGALARAYAAPHAFDKSKLCILPSFQCWKLCVDILVFKARIYAVGFVLCWTHDSLVCLTGSSHFSRPNYKLDCCAAGVVFRVYCSSILECGGNLFDAIGLGVKAALRTTRIPRVVTAIVDGADPELILSGDPEDCWLLDVSNAPLLVTVIKIGENCVVDPGAEEEAVGRGGLLIAYGGGLLTTVLKLGEGSLHPNSFKELLKMAVTAGKALHIALNGALDLELELGDKRPKSGFLK